MQLEMFNSHDFGVRFSNMTTPSGDPITLSPYETKLPPFMIGMAAAYGVLFACGGTANLWTLLVIGCVLRERNNDAPRNVQIYIFSLCCSDLVILTSLTLLMTDLLAGRWALGSTWLCHLYLFSESLNKFFGPFILTALSGTCCLSVCLPTRRPGSSRVETLVACLVVFVCIVVVTALSMPMYIYGDVYYLVIHNTTHFYYLPKCAFYPPEDLLYAFNMYSFVLGYGVPAALFTFFYGALVAYVILRSRTALFDNSSYSWKVAKTASGLVLFYLFCWTPYWAIILYSYFNPLQDTSGTNALTYLNYAVHLLPYINCAGYPILYTLLNRKIKRVYQRVKLRRRRHSSTNGVDQQCCLGFGSTYIGNTTYGSTTNALTTINSPSVILCNSDRPAPRYRTMTYSGGGDGGGGGHRGSGAGDTASCDYANNRNQVGVMPNNFQRKNKKKKISAPSRLYSKYAGSDNGFKKNLWG